MMFEDVINKKHLMFDSMHYGLDKLSKDEIYSLMKDYYEGMKIKELLKNIV